MKSEQIDQLATALSKAQAELESAKKDANNPFFKSKYADLTSVWAAARPVLAKYGLAVAQTPGQTGLTTILMHSSGQYIEDTMPIVVAKQNDPQALGSAITYARRYALAAIVGIVADDDDGNAASGKEVKSAKVETVGAAHTGRIEALAGARIKTLAAERQPKAMAKLIEELAGTAVSSLEDNIDAILRGWKL